MLDISRIMTRSAVTLIGDTSRRSSAFANRISNCCKKARRSREIRVNTITGRTTGSGAQEVSEIAGEARRRWGAWRRRRQPRYGVCVLRHRWGVKAIYFRIWGMLLVRGIFRGVMERSERGKARVGVFF